MRLLLLASSMVVSTAALADVWQNRVVWGPEEGSSLDGAAALTASSKILYVNDCKPNGCQVTRGQDSSLTNSSSILSSATTSITLDPYAHGDAHWADVIECVKETMAPFDIQVVTTDPGPSTSHYEVMTGGTAGQLRAGLEAGGIAPFISCNAARNNVLVFVFANQTSSKPYLCAAIAHEAGHAYGLSHSLNAKDPMTYMDLGGSKAWQNADQQCGTETPEQCRCTGARQNSFRYLNQTWGLNPGLAQPMLVVTSPREGRWVAPGFPIAAVFDTQLDMLDAKIAIDGANVATLLTAPLAFNAPTTLAPGEHTIAVTATDFGDRMASATVKVNVMKSCATESDCASDFGCYMGLCMPGKNVDGGFGASCMTNDECVSGSCAMAAGETTGFCSGRCDATITCPGGFSCDGGVCVSSDSGGCSTSSGGGFVLFGVAGLALALRRRRR